MTSVRFGSPAWPRFVTVSLHRNPSLLTITFTGLHVLTTITDPFASISAVSVVVPFTSWYRRTWLGFGAVAFDLLLAVLVTSLPRTRIGPRAWRAVHWADYACWPVALVHGLGTGTDGAARWVLAITAVCALAVVSAGVWRLAETARVVRYLAGQGAGRLQEPPPAPATMSAKPSSEPKPRKPPASRQVTNKVRRAPGSPRRRSA